MVSKTKQKRLDLSSEEGHGERSAEFIVELYDYDELQSGVSSEDAQFETDLQCLLTSPPKSAQLPKLAKRKAMKLIKEKDETRLHIKYRTLRTRLEEITKDINDIVFSSDEEETESNDACEEEKNIKKSKSEQRMKNGSPIDEVNISQATSETPSKKSSSVEAENKTVNDDQKEDSAGEKKNCKTKESGLDDKRSPRNIEITELPGSIESNGEESASMKKRKNRRAKRKKSAKDDTEANLAASLVSPPPARQREQQAPRKISPAQVSSTILPEKEPVSTIIGLSPTQIMAMKKTDVKFKTILSVPSMLRMCRNVLEFVQRESDGFLKETRFREPFTELCVHVALRESHGFQDISKKHPKLMDRLSGIRELLLEHTKTSLTESNRQVHKNNFDYTVFSYLGHIIIWISNLQWREKKPVLLENIGISQKDVMASIGGYHLWDRIRRDPKTINMKRWKHIQKFRQNYAFEMHQFIVILRFMHLGEGL